MLISCPNCGKVVSDKAESCLHCGFILNKRIKTEKEHEEKELTEIKDYYELSKEERKNLLLEFGKEEPLQNKAIRGNRIAVIAQLILLGVAILLTILGAKVAVDVGKIRLDVVEPTINDFIASFGLIGVAIVVWIVFIIFNLILKATRQKSIIAYKHFERWLNKQNIEGFADMEMEDSVERAKMEDLDL